MITYRFLLQRLLFLSGIFPLAGSAALRFETNQLEFTAMAGTVEIVTAFPFRNSGDAQVTISELRTSCSCITAEVIKNDYRPGEGGRIEVRFHPGDRTGLVERSITVFTADQSVIRMRLRVNLIEPVSSSPQSISWQKDAPPIEHYVEVAAGASSIIHAINIDESDLKKFAQIRVDQVKPGRRYRLVIVPLGTQQSQETPLHYIVEFTDGSTRTLMVSTVIK